MAAVGERKMESNKFDIDVPCFNCSQRYTYELSATSNLGRRFEESTRFPILTGDWNAGELFQLLEGIEQFGYGNWNDVSRDVGTKGPTECRDAVNQSFVDGPIGSRTYEEKNRGNAVDHTPKPAPTAGKKETDLSINDMLALGWLPNRDEFEVEHCNEAETLVSSLDQGKNDEVEDEVETALKLSQVEMYQAKLKDRERRRQTAADHDLITQFFIEQNTYKPKKKDGKPDLLDRLKLVSNFQTVPEHKTFMSNMGREKELKSRIKELNRYRKNGVTRSKDGEEFDLQRLRRNKIKTERKKALEAGIDIPPSLLEHPQGGIDLDTITNISILPGYDLLSLNEKRLCSSLRLHPNLYNAYKTCIIRDNAMKRRGHIIRPSNPSGLDKLHRKKIMNFLLQSGWISAY